MYRYIILNTCLEGKDGAVGTDYDAVLSDHFVKKHLFYAVETVLATKRQLTQNRSWRLSVTIAY